MVDPQQDTNALERELAARLEHLTSAEQQALLVEALDLLTIEEKLALLSWAVEVLALSGQADDTALPGRALQLYRDSPTA